MTLNSVSLRKAAILCLMASGSNTRTSMGCQCITQPTISKPSDFQRDCRTGVVLLALSAASSLSIAFLAGFCRTGLNHDSLLPLTKVRVPKPLASVEVEHVSSSRTHKICSPWTRGRSVWEITRSAKRIVVGGKRIALLIKALNLAIRR